MKVGPPWSRWPGSGTTGTTGYPPLRSKTTDRFDFVVVKLPEAALEQARNVHFLAVNELDLRYVNSHTYRCSGHH